MPVPRRILITGSGGFVGSHLMPALRGTYPDATLIGLAADITDQAAVQAEVADVRPDAVVHLAAIAAIPAARQDPDLAWSVNLHGTRYLARAIMAHAPAAILVFASTADLYGATFRAGVPVDEDAMLAPLNAYAATKAAADLALGALAAEGLRVIRMRPFNHTGPGQTDAFVVAAFARQVARIAAGLQVPAIKVGDLSPLRDFLDVRDVCASYVLALGTDLPPGTILNVASGQARRVGDVLNDMLTIAGVSADVQVDAARLRPTDIPAAIGDATRLRALGWTPAIPWAQTLADTLAYWKHKSVA